MSIKRCWFFPAVLLLSSLLMVATWTASMSDTVYNVNVEHVSSWPDQLMMNSSHTYQFKITVDNACSNPVYTGSIDVTSSMTASLGTSDFTTFADVGDVQICMESGGSYTQSVGSVPVQLTVEIIACDPTTRPTDCHQCNTTTGAWDENKPNGDACPYDCVSGGWQLPSGITGCHTCVGTSWELSPPSGCPHCCDVNTWKAVYPNGCSPQYCDGTEWKRTGECNGCSVPPIPFVDGDNPGGFPFGGACDGHDLCYDDCEAEKSDCDDEFYAELEDVCDAELPADYDDCMDWTDIYYGVVDHAGAGPFTTAQQCCHESGDVADVGGYCVAI